MNLDEIKHLEESDFSYISEGRIQTIEDINGVCFINEKIAIPITEISPYYKDEEDIPINDEDGNNLGMLCFCKKINPIYINELTDWQFVAFLIDSNYDELIYPTFKFDYLVLEKSKYQEYIDNYYKSAPLWGKFCHTVNIPQPHRLKQNEIIAIKNILLPTNYHEENSIRAIKEPYSFERYLKQYHLLELVFDLELVNKIKALNDDLMGIGKVLNDYKRDDIERLKSIVSLKCTDHNAIARLLNKVEPHINKAQLVFFDFGKDNNPLKSFIDLNNILSETDGFEKPENVKKHASIKETDYPAFILKLATYWVYRIRCCIAHNKIGEYVMKYDDEPFVAEFGEMLLNEILIQVLKI